MKYLVGFWGFGVLGFWGWSNKSLGAADVRERNSLLISPPVGGVALLETVQTWRSPLI